MRSDADIVGAESTVESQGTLLLGDLGEAVEHTAVGELAIGTLGLLLQPSLDEVEGQAEEGGEETGDGAGSEGLGSSGQIGVGLELGLGLAEEGELTEVESHGSDDSGGGTGPESTDTFALGNRGKGIDNGLVVLSLSQGLETVTLHSDKGQVGRVANHGSNTSSSETGGCSLGEADSSSFSLGSLLERSHEGVEDAQAGSGVDGLSEKTSGQTSVQVQNTSTSNDLSSDSDGAGLGARGSSLAGELDADLDHIDGLDNSGGNHAAEAAVDERKGSLGQRRSQKVLGDGNGVALGRTQDLAGLGSG